MDEMKQHGPPQDKEGHQDGQQLGTDGYVDWPFHSYIINPMRCSWNRHEEDPLLFAGFFSILISYNRKNRLSQNNCCTVRGSIHAVRAANTPCRACYHETF